ncbi:MAG: hypothetical protein QXD89_01500 [Candidatus Aenigmatarchaeota archaeon]
MEGFFKDLYRGDVPIEEKDIKRIKELVSSYYKVPERILENIKLSYNKLPQVYLILIKKFGSYIQVFYKPVAKILGFYDSDKKEIKIDYRLPYHQKIKTLIHEYIHAVQDYLGKLYKESREKIEEEAYKVSNYLFKIYNQTSQKFPSFLNYLIPI